MSVLLLDYSMRVLRDTWMTLLQFVYSISVLQSDYSMRVTLGSLFEFVIVCLLY